MQHDTKAVNGIAAALTAMGYANVLDKSFDNPTLRVTGKTGNTYYLSLNELGGGKASLEKEITLPGVHTFSNGDPGYPDDVDANTIQEWGNEVGANAILNQALLAIVADETNEALGNYLEAEYEKEMAAEEEEQERRQAEWERGLDAESEARTEEMLRQFARETRQLVV